MASTDKFVGYLVSVDCKDIFYQGVVTQIDPNKAMIQLKNVFQNGIHCGSKLVDIKTTEIENIEILADPQNALALLNPKTAINEQSSAKLTDETNKLQPKVSKHIKTSNSQYNINNNNNNNHSNISPGSSSPPNNNHNYDNRNTNKRKAHHGGNNYHNDSQSDINTMNMDQDIEDDFDFESNLALFDKNKLYEELGQPILNNSSASNEPQLNAYDSLVKQLNSNKQNSSSNDQRYHKISVANLFSSQTPSMPAPAAPISTNTTPANGVFTQNSNGLLVNSNNSAKTPSIPSSNGVRNYRYDEMVLGTGEPVNLQQIQVPCNLNKQYVTDDGFVIPCIDSEIRDNLFRQSYKHGFNKQREIESMGRCCTEMAIQLIGGPLRFSPKNNHQKPTILFLVNDSSIQGAYAMCTARQLSIRKCKVFIFVAKTGGGLKDDDIENFNNEFNLFQSTEPSENTYLKNMEDLRAVTSVDLIINAIDNTSSNQPWYRGLVKYIDNCKASVLSIDPCPEGSQIKSKWCVLPVLPKPMSDCCGRVYLCDLGFTKSMFNSVNIKYQSPFGAKFCIPLHND